MTLHARAGQPATPADLIDVDAVLRSYTDIIPDPTLPTQRVVFGTSGHRGTSLNGSFNETHIRAISLAIARVRDEAGITGPLYLGADTHPLSAPAAATAIRVLTAAGVRVLVSDDYVPTPGVSHAIIEHNRHRASSEGTADGILITPSHNPPQDGGFKYNPPHGGPADDDVTRRIAQIANELIEQGAEIAQADDPQPERFDFITPYVQQLGEIIDLDRIRAAGLRIGAHALGGTSHAYWEAIADTHDLDITVLGPKADPQWSFMTLDWDGQIRMDPSSPHAMALVDAFRGDFDLVVANDADADRFGIVTAAGLQQPNHVLAVAIDHLLSTRRIAPGVKIGKTLVSSALIDRVVASHGRELVEVPVGFKWFVSGLHDGTLLFGGEESAGASFLRNDSSAWSTDKDGILMCLLAAEITAVTGRSIDENYRQLTSTLGDPHYARIDSAATPAQKAALKTLDARAVTDTELAGDAIVSVLTEAPGNGASIGGLKVATEHAWFAARPSGTEDVTKVYAESFRGADHLATVLDAAQALVARALESNA